MRECISIHIGQAGIQMGDSSWQLYCLEHGLNPAGMKNTPDSNSEKILYDTPSNIFFSETAQGNMVPRTIMVDLEPSVIDCVRKGDHRNLYHPDHLINGKEDAANNFARGFYTVGREILPTVLDCIRKIATQCESLQGFIISHSIGGGTGSGFTSLLMEKLSDYYPTQSKLQTAVYPSPRISSAIVEPYNAIMSTHTTMTHSNCCFLLDNESLYDICSNRLDIKKPNYTSLNKLISSVNSSLTASLRFEGLLNADLADFQMNLVPYPRLHFPIVSQSPIVLPENVHFEDMSVMKITSDLFRNDNLLLKCDPTDGKYMGCCLLYRGDIAARDVNEAISTMMRLRDLRFVDWCPNGFKVAFNDRLPVSTFGSGSMSRSATLLANTTAVQSAWKSLNSKFNLLFSKKAFVHWYINEGMDEDEFRQAFEDLVTLEMDYKEAARDCLETVNLDEAEY